MLVFWKTVFFLLFGVMFFVVGRGMWRFGKVVVFKQPDAEGRTGPPAVLHAAIDFFWHALIIMLLFAVGGFVLHQIKTIGGA